MLFGDFVDFYVNGGGFSLPTIIADYRNDRHLIAIWVLNFFVGWTVIGWAAALIWSLTDNVRYSSASRQC